MEQLVNDVSQRTGLPQAQAQQAAQAVIDFLKGRLPGPIASQLDNLLGGQAASGQGQQGGLAGLGDLGGLFGGGNQGNQGN